MASSDNRGDPPPNPAQHNELDEDELSMRPSLREDEASQLADFDRYMQHALDSSTPQSSSEAMPGSQPFSSFTDQAHPANSANPAKPASADAQRDAGTSTSANQQREPPSLATLFPTYDHEALAAVLAACDGNRTAAIKMLRQSTQSQRTSQPRATAPAPAPAPASSTPADTLESDAELAARLHRLETAQVRPRRATIPVRLEPSVLAQLVASLREIVVPALRAHFEELVLPDRREESGSFVYELRNLQVAALTLPAENVSVRPAVNGTTVLVNVVNANLQLEVGQWSYEGRGFVPVNDSGRASVAAHGVSIAMRLEARRAQGGRTRIMVPQCDVTVDGVVRFKTQGAAADWAYNAMAVVFKPWVVSYIKEAVADAVVRALAVHLRQWELAMESEETNTANAPTSQAAQPPVTASE